MSRKIFLTAFFVCVFSQSVLSAEDLQKYKNAAVEKMQSQYGRILYEGSQVDIKLRQIFIDMGIIAHNRTKYADTVAKKGILETFYIRQSALDRANISSSSISVFDCIRHQLDQSQKAIDTLLTEKMSDLRMMTSSLLTELTEISKKWSKDWLEAWREYNSELDKSISAVYEAIWKSQVDEIVSAFSIRTRKVEVLVREVIPGVVVEEKEWYRNTNQLLDILKTYMNLLVDRQIQETYKCFR